MPASRVQPPGSPYDPKWYVGRPTEEQMALDCLTYAKPVLVWGPRMHGRSWFARRVLSLWRESEGATARVVTVDFTTFGEAPFASLDTFLRELVLKVAEDLADERDEDPEEVAEEFWSGLGGPKTRFNRFLKRWVLAGDGKVLVLLNHADLLLPCDFYSDFAGLLRSWAEKTVERSPWDRLRLLVAVSTYPGRLVTEKYQSPFANLCAPILLGDFGPQQVCELAHLHGLDWPSEKVTDLMGAVGGHPHLLRCVLSDIVAERYGLDELVAGVLPDSGLLAEHLKRHRLRLESQPMMAKALAALAENPAASVPAQTLDDLVRQGLVDSGAGGTYPVQCGVYEQLARECAACDAGAADEKAPCPGAEQDEHPRGARLFFSYAHEDEELLRQLIAHLKPLERRGLIVPWTDRKLAAGDEWDTEIRAQLERADVILLLVSSHFTNSDYIWENELKLALERHEAREASIVPIIVRPCVWNDLPFSKVQVVPKDALPVMRWTDPDDAWVDVAMKLRELVEELRQERPETEPSDR